MAKLQTQVKRYKGEKAYQRDANRMSAKGWQVISVTSENPRAGCGRILAIGIFAALWKPKPVLIVTYQREK
jgi:hypothetical protein